MAYITDMKSSANRHYEDGRKLEHDKRYDNAGYHYGFAAECAVKHCLRQTGVRDDDDAIWTHFPALKTFALLALSSRRAAELRKMLSRQSFMQSWEIKMRYSCNGSVAMAELVRWRQDAGEAIGLLVVS